MKYSLVALLTLFSSITIAQTIQCPADLTIELFDLDTDYATYGQPTASGPGTYDISQSITTVNSSCNGVVILLTYDLIDQATLTSVASCDQVLTVNQVTAEDFTFPEDFTVAQGTLDDIDPEITGQVEPYDFIEFSNSAVGYGDEVFNNNGRVRVVRTWSIFDFCSGELTQHDQIIIIESLISIGSGPLPVVSCNTNEEVIVDRVILTTDVPSYTVFYGTCATSQTDLTGFVNCVAALNDIPSDNSFTIELEKGEYLNGVSTLDLVLTQRHILGIKPLESDCHLISADVNNDGSITAVDLLETRKLILGINETFPRSPSWKFFNDNSGNPFIINDDLKFRKSEFPLTPLVVKAIKIGDVNDSAR
jgi:hypothetical protein